jgi:hypothetical protein
MTRLCSFAQIHGTDKYPWYTPFYDLLLRDVREDIRTVLEIGIGTIPTMRHMPGYQPGASLRMWRDYFPNATIYGIDIAQDAVYLARGEGIETFLADASKQSELLRIAAITGKLDLIIDDGSHDPEHQILAAHTLMPYLNHGGLYIIEDVNDPEAVSQGLGLPHHIVRCRQAGDERQGKLILIQGDHDADI